MWFNPSLFLLIECHTYFRLQNFRTRWDFPLILAKRSRREILDESVSNLARDDPKFSSFNLFYSQNKLFNWFFYLFLFLFFKSIQKSAGVWRFTMVDPFNSFYLFIFLRKLNPFNSIVNKGINYCPQVWSKIQW